MEVIKTGEGRSWRCFTPSKPAQARAHKDMGVGSLSGELGELKDRSALEHTMLARRGDW